MSDEIKKEETNEVVPTSEEQEGTSELSNAEAKQKPWVKDLMARAARGDALEKAETERVAAAEEASKEAKLKGLKAKGESDAVIAALEVEIADGKKRSIAKEDRHTAELQKRDIRNELLRAGFSNDKFISGSITDYKPDNDGTIAEYVDSLAKDESNAAFLGTISIREPKVPPTGVGSMGAKPDMKEIQRLVTIFRELRSGSTQDGRIKLKSPSSNR